MILVTGGAGYIGSHTVVELMQAGFEVLIVDNFCNSKASVLARIERIVGRRPRFVEGDVRDRETMRALFAGYHFDAVIHFAGLKAVGESITQPIRYYDNNIHGSLVLFEAMEAAGVKTLVFSSSATVYGDPHTVPIREDFPLSATNPYGRSKLIVEEMLGDIARADNAWHIALLRYFNPVGAHESGLIGEDPHGIPNNLMPYISKVAVGSLAELSVFGSDYPTHDGTGVRDYIHVVDLARGHLEALKTLSATTGVMTVNLGTGQGYSVLDVVRAFERASGKKVPYRIVGRRPGDIAACFADPSLAKKLLGWQAQLGIDDMCRDAWRWQSMSRLEATPIAE
ncbi:MAG: UDP-glucose 4-epimerase GalE [Gammaproteobacteria bacterium]|nr:UDP-glucose 4-epimerase GalE [Gammaproteobacteria bacterium]MBU1483054.1 UDP-glucose 4-epimerase GalE [Gammaproteobacteria bacterium]